MAGDLFLAINFQDLSYLFLFPVLLHPLNRLFGLKFDLDQINPLSKIVIFNLSQAFSILGQIDYTNINEIRFDGDTLWLPAES